ncbi:cell division cycle protein 20 homolog B-like [Cottoperca gobio]|uniref:Cell division cycle protein 20 homolog B-like n=1 Tax=Cottoperca gobio TaxID=56716 RepID=A0A6J2QFW3_COTGO|nr:cell division cycle protein 20 homolog B [Cottoperca gobio]
MEVAGGENVRCSRRSAHLAPEQLIIKTKLEMKLTGGESNDLDNMRRMLRDFVGKRRHCPFKTESSTRFFRMIPRTNAVASCRTLSTDSSARQNRTTFPSGFTRNFQKFHLGIFCTESETQHISKRSLMGQNDAHDVSYRSFRRRITQRSSSEGPAASTPLATGRRCESRFELDTVCQTLELDSPPRHHEPAQRDLQGNLQETALAGISHCGGVQNPLCTFTARGWPDTENVPQQGRVWRSAVQEQGNARQAGSDGRRHALQPFDVLDNTSVNQQGKSVMMLAAPSLLNDYYTNLLDYSCNGMIALALGSSVYLWNSETRALVGYLDPSPQPGQAYIQTISCLSWSRDGRTLCIGTRRGEIQLWDVEQKQNMRCLPSHLSVVRALSWKQQLLSSGSVLGRIHHFDPRAATPLVGAAVQKEAICSLQWSPGEDWLASGSTEGLLCIWDSDITGVTRSRQPITTIKQPSAVKAMGWCPWQRKMIATGGGWKDGELRIWDTDSGTCVTSANTKSQICSLRWAEKKRYLVTGHGRPHHQVNCWSWECPSLSPVYQLRGHSHRVLHLAINPDSTQMFSAGADQRFHIWDM